MKAKHRWYEVGVILAAAIALASMASAEPPEASHERFRGDLLSFAAELEEVPELETDQIAGLAQLIEALTPEQLARLESLAPRATDWRALPRVLRALERVKAERAERLRAKLDTAQAQREPAAELEDFRSDLSFLLTSLRAFAPLDARGQLDPQLEDLQLQVESFPAEHLEQLRRVYYHNAPRWMLMLRSGPSGDRPHGKSFDLLPTIPSLDCNIGCPCDFGCDLNCSCTEICVPFFGCATVCDPICLAAEALCEVGEAACDVGCGAVEGLCNGLDEGIAGLNSVINEINGFLNEVAGFFITVINEIGALPNTIGNFFTELGNDLVGLLQILLDAVTGLIPDPAELLGLMGLDVSGTAAAASLFVDLVNSSPVLSIPCPEVGVEIPFYGTVGTPRAEYVCKRGIDWLSEKLFDLVPADTASVALKVTSALFYFPIKYFCMCMEAQSALCFADGQKIHRELVAQQLDAKLSTRATQTSVDALQAGAGQLAASVDNLQSDVANVDQDVGIVSSGLSILDTTVDNFSGNAQNQSELLAAFRELVLRVRIEENLLEENAEDVVALFNSPPAFGSFLERVREIVATTIQMNLATGQPIFNAGAFLAQGDALFNEGVFDKAYLAYGKAYREAVKESAAGGPRRDSR